MSDKTEMAQTIMIAESDEDSRFLLKYLLEASGYRVVEVSSGQEVLELALQVKPDLILLELMMPLFKGFSAARQIRQAEELRNVPIVAISIFPPAQHRAVVLAAGCNEYMRKPVELDQLEILIARLLKSETQCLVTV